MLIAWCRAPVDLTLADATPTLAVTDPVILARATRASVFVARPDMTAPAEIEAAIKAFPAPGLRVSGAALNGFDPRKARGGRCGWGCG